MLDRLEKVIAIAAIASASAGCTIGRLHATLVDMNKVKSSSFEEAPPKPAAQVNIQWDF